MPRDKQFDVDEALDRAKLTFWKRGYDATSMAMLLKAMGINRGSFYGTFTSKHAVLLEALRRYDAIDRRRAINEVAEGRPPREAIAAVFEALIDPNKSLQGCHGCFLVNMALELAPKDRAVRAIVGAAFADIAGFFERLIAMGQQRGEISDKVDAQSAGQALLNQLSGLMVMVRSGAPQPMLRAVVRQATQLPE